jgi:hypothetical protein
MATVFDDLDRQQLATLAREYLLCGHLIDRAAMPFVFAAGGMEVMRDVAIDEWMGASPIYTPRIRRALGFDGDDVETIFKGMQFDIGAPPQFMDFRYKVVDAKHGEFELAHCGALMDVEPMGLPFVTTMCHDIEDPTFDATAAATNPRARMRPIHRPPRTPVDRMPHCLWTVTIEDDAEPLPFPEQARHIAESRAATVELPSPAGPDDDGRTTYEGPIEADLHLEKFSRHSLIRLTQEICLQGHLLTLTFNDAVKRRLGVEAASEIARKRFIGIAGVAARRVMRALGGGPSMEDVLRFHPAFHPASYIDVRIEDGSISLHDCPAMGEGSWADLLATGEAGPLDAMVQAVDARARCTSVEPANGALKTWAISMVDEPANEVPEVAVTKISTGAEFVFEERR